MTGKSRDIGTWGQFDTQFLLGSFVVVVEGDAFTYFAGGDAHYRVGAGVVVVRSLENLDAQDAFFQAVEIAFEGAANDVGKERGISPAVAEMVALQHSIELLKNGLAVDRRRSLANPAFRLILHSGGTLRHWLQDSRWSGKLYNARTLRVIPLSGTLGHPGTKGMGQVEGGKAFVLAGDLGTELVP